MADIAAEGTTLGRPRYPSHMIWGSLALAAALGVVVAAGVYAAYLWPNEERIDQPDIRAGDASAPPVPATTEATRTRV